MPTEVVPGGVTPSTPPVGTGLELSYQQVLLKSASNLIEIFCASMLGRTSLVCLYFRAAVVVVVAVPERAKYFLPKFPQFQPIGCLFCQH